MKGEQLTIAETLKFTRHDFLNDLQIILMNLDLGNTEQAREKILKTTEKMKQHSNLFSLGMPEVEIWLATFEWLHTSFTKELTCRVDIPITEVDDEDLVLSLQAIIDKTEKDMDVFSVYTAHIDVLSSVAEWTITIKVTGSLPDKVDRLNEKATFLVEEQYAENLWTFTIRGR